MLVWAANGWGTQTLSLSLARAHTPSRMHRLIVADEMRYEKAASNRIKWEIIAFYVRGIDFNVKRRVWTWLWLLFVVVGAILQAWTQPDVEYRMISAWLVICRVTVSLVNYLYLSEMRFYLMAGEMAVSAIISFVFDFCYIHRWFPFLRLHAVPLVVPMVHL